MTAVLDAGALIAIARRDRRIGAILRLLHREGVPVQTSAGAVAQVWRGGSRQANLARALPGVAVAGLDDEQGRRVGELLGANRTVDVVDAHVALLVERGGSVLTSDARDMEALLVTRQVPARVIRV